MNIITNNNNEFSNILGNVHFSTLAPGSPGVLNGLIPHDRDYPPYSKGNIQMYVNFDGYYPWLGQLSMNMLDDVLKNKEHQGSEVGRRPHDAKDVNDKSSSGSGGGIEIKSVTQVSASLIQVEIDIFIEQRKPVEIASSQDSSDIFCSPRGLFNWITSSFFKEPIAICFPSLLDFFQL